MTEILIEKFPWLNAGFADWQDGRNGNDPRPGFFKIEKRAEAAPQPVSL
jgi:hypothetical protein